ncbi:hypothetical protein P691DRAFT_363226 [Macrolepiota fuliginosa MF-IS2]|uniref:Nephrocystin 3-like N-terminal domain-containing protein n=1 Tax=Macrolepiota fuliginosa MF-IS2 TaxID=1400762 RepID=A0A9P5X412_9AGAR|nr:hypothetical protein P691DRAFT_363226 [Macrolepiota fuliginosa MF-IS2]
MPLFSGAQHFVINNSHFIEQIPADSGGPTAGIDILLEASTPGAAYDSSARHSPPRCFPGTREQYVEDITNWVVPVPDHDPPPLYWMTGLAGVGKSAIAQTCVEKIKAQGTLGASFFFSLNGRNNPARLFPTIAYQLSMEFPDFHDVLNRKIWRNKTLIDKVMASQFQGLIVDPLKELKRNGKGIGRRIAIFVDGLDECEGAEAQCDIIEIIAAAARDSTLPFCWALFTRPEPHIRAIFATPEVAQLTYKAELPVSHDADRDIELYLRGGFGNILRRRDILLKSQWPSDNDVRTLVHAAGGLFIYVATALRVVAQSGSLPEESLRRLLADTSNNGHNLRRGSKSSFAELDAFYMLIMQRIPSGILPTVLLFLQILCASPSHQNVDPRGALFMSNVLGLSEIELKAVCNQLSAVVHFHGRDEFVGPVIPTVDTTRPFQHADPEIVNELRSFIFNQLGGSISFYHKSFYDFLLDSTRSATFCVTSPVICNALFAHSLGLQLKYQESYCFQDSELVLAPGIPDSAYSLSWPHTDELINSMLKVLANNFLQRTCLDLISIPLLNPRVLQQFKDADSRKTLHLTTVLYGHGQLMSTTLFGCQSYARSIPGTQLIRQLPHEFSRFDIHRFEKLIERLRQMGIIWTYQHSLASFMSSLPTKSQEQRISGLYCIGNGPKSIFWYWEIDFQAKYYQEFRTIDLAEGARIYREERFDLWPTK